MAAEDPTVHPTMDEMKNAGAVGEPSPQLVVKKDQSTTVSPTTDDIKKSGAVVEHVPAPEVKKDEDPTVHPTNDEVKNAQGPVAAPAQATPQQQPTPLEQHASMQAEAPKRYRTRTTQPES